MFEAFPTAGVKPAVGVDFQEAGNSWPRDGMVSVWTFHRWQVTKFLVDTQVKELTFCLRVLFGMESYFLSSCKMVISSSPWI
jgi:hypothetical protein